MHLEKTYIFNSSTNSGIGKQITKSKNLFLNHIHECEKDFYSQFRPIYPNTFVSNRMTLELLQSCFNIESNHIFGMESINGYIDIEMNLEIEKFSKNKTVYAIGSGIPNREDDAILLVSDNSYSNYQFSLKFLPDNGTENINDFNHSPDLQCKYVF